MNNEIRGTILGVPITRAIVFGGLYWGPPEKGPHHFKAEVAASPEVSTSRTSVASMGRSGNPSNNVNNLGFKV